MLTTEEVGSMLVNQLKEELKVRGASVLGKKAELASRLLELINAHEESNNNDTTDEANQKESTEMVDVSSAEVVVCTDDKARVAPVEEAVSHNHTIVEEVVEEESGKNKLSAGDNELNTHVRIDNFQRPLNQKALVEWIEKTCHCTLAPESLWINSIKTHCYVDFQSYDEALRCIDKVKGQRYPPTSAYILEADFTSVSAKEAPGSAEGAMKPGEWKALAAQADSKELAEGEERVKNRNAQKAREDSSTEQGEEMETTTDVVNNSTSSEGNPAVSTVGSKRRIDAVESTSIGNGDGGAGGAGGAGEGKARRVAGLDIFRRATAGILFGGRLAPSNSSNNNTSPRHSEQGQEMQHTETPTVTVTGFITRKARSAEDQQRARTVSGVRGEGSSNSTEAGEGEAHAAVAEEGLVLEDLFRKTVSAAPALYWMPAPDEVVQQRLKSRLLLKSRK